MIKKIVQSLLRPPVQSSRALFAAEKPAESQPQPQKRAQTEKFSREDEQEQQQPKFQQQDRSTPWWKFKRVVVWGSFALLTYSTYMVATHNKATPVEDEPYAIPYFINGGKYIYNAAGEVMEYLSKPPSDKLLPDVLHPLIQPKTLVLSVSGTLLHIEYVFGKGLIVKKRPGLQQFLNKMAPLYEIVVFSDEDSMMLDSLVPNLDPRRQFIQEALGQESMVWTKDGLIKDLKYLNRDLKKVIVIDKTKKKVPRQAENVITLSEYKGGDDDKQLVSLGLLLENLAKPEIKDVRKTLQQIGENPVKLYEQKLKQNLEKIKKNKGSRIFGFFSKQAEPTKSA